jgi:hypothetical protein
MCSVLCFFPRSASACSLGNLTVGETVCRQLNSNGSLNPTNVRFVYHRSNDAAFSCAMYRSLDAQRVAIRTVEGQESSLEAIAEHARAYGSVFPREAQKALGLLEVMITPGECVVGERRTYAIWMFEEMALLEDLSACLPFKVLMFVRLSDFCSGDLHALELVGIKHLAETADPRISLRAARYSVLQIGPAVRANGGVKLYRNRYTDVNDDAR